MNDNMIIETKFIAIYYLLDIICHVKVLLFSVSGPISVAIIGLFEICSDRFLCKINSYCYKHFTIEM